MRSKIWMTVPLAALLGALAAAPVHAGTTAGAPAPLSAACQARLDAYGRAGRTSDAARAAIATKLAAWDRLRCLEAKAPYADLYGFLMTNRGWPQERQMRGRLEQSMTPAVPHTERLAYFERHPAITAAGRLRHAEALAATGLWERAGTLAREAWTSGSLGPEDEQRLLSLFRARLTPDDHLARVDQQLWQGMTSAARRMLPFLDADRQAWAQARIALRAQAADAPAMADRVPASLQANAGLLLDRALWYRNKGNDPARAAQILAGAPASPGDIARPAIWAEERLRLARWATGAGNPVLAYRLVSQHGLAASGADAPDAERIAVADLEWQAGWLALHDIRRPRDAIRHFERMFAIARTPITLSKAAFWAGRAAEAVNDGPLARAWYDRAAQFADAFYGQLAAEKLSIALPSPELTPPPLLANQAVAFAASDLVQATRLLNELGESPTESVFIRELASAAQTPAEKRLAADLAQALNRPDLGVVTAKLARGKGINLAYASYPRIPLARELEGMWTMVHAISRQESLFNIQAVSPAGARGLMQLMPGTAQLVAKKVGLPYEPARLTTDPAYNMTLGATYFQQMLDRFRGNHVLAVAAYNAGPGRVARWLERFGDPRDPTVDTVSWIEQIPFSETRNYVQRVLENAVIYQSIAPDGGTGDKPAGQPRLKALSRLLGLTGDS